MRFRVNGAEFEEHHAAAATAADVVPLRNAPLRERMSQPAGDTGDDDMHAPL